MSKLLVFLIAIAALASATDPPAPPSDEEVKAQLVAAGLSETTASEIVSIGKKYEAKLEAANGNKDAMQAVFADIKKETDGYIAKASAADQTAYAAFVEKKKAEIEAHHTTPAHH